MFTSEKTTSTLCSFFMRKLPAAGLIELHGGPTLHCPELYEPAIPADQHVLPLLMLLSNDECTHTYIPLNNRCKANNTPINTQPSKHVHTLGWDWKVIILPLLGFLWRSHDKQSLLSKCRHLSAPKKMLSGADNVQMLNCIMYLYHM